MASRGCTSHTVLVGYKKTQAGPVSQKTLTTPSRRNFKTTTACGDGQGLFRRPSFARTVCDHRPRKTGKRVGWGQDRCGTWKSGPSGWPPMPEHDSRTKVQGSKGLMEQSACQQRWGISHRTPRRRLSQASSKPSGPVLIAAATLRTFAMPGTEVVVSRLDTTRREGGRSGSGRSGDDLRVGRRIKKELKSHRRQPE